MAVIINAGLQQHLLIFTFSRHRLGYPNREAFASNDVGLSLNLPIIVIISILTPHTDWLVQERRNFIADALELRLSCTEPLICYVTMVFVNESSLILANLNEVDNTC